MYTSRPLVPVPAPSDATPLALGSEGPGTDTELSRADHRHPMPSATDVGVVYSNATPLALGSQGAGTSTNVSRADHRHPMPSASDVGAAATSHTHAVTQLSGTANALAAFDGSGVGTSRAIASDVSALLNAANNAAMRTALAVQDGPRVLPLFHYTSSSKDTLEVAGEASFVPSDYSLTGRTTTLTLVAVGRVTSVAQTATLELVNSAGSVVATLTWTETTPTRKTASVTLPGSAEIWQARVSCAGVVDSLTDYALFGGAHVRITWS